MTLKDLIEQIPIEYHDCFILIDIPEVRAGDQGNYPLIQYSIDDSKDGVRIILEADVY